jgi:hypothetical protein
MVYYLSMIIWREQAYRTNRLYFHGTPHPGKFTNLIFGREEVVFITPYINYAAVYAQGKTIHIIKLLKSLDIFNARSPTDFMMLMKTYMMDDVWNGWTKKQQSDFKEIISNGDWLALRNLRYKKKGIEYSGTFGRALIIEIVRSLGYDGFYNYESAQTSEHYEFVNANGGYHSKIIDQFESGPAMGIFNPANLKIVGRADASEYRRTGKIKLIIDND